MPKELISIEVPGSKSLSNRALILSVLSNQKITLKNVALCDDTDYMIKALKELGVKIHQNGTTVKIQGIQQNSRLNFPQKKKVIKIFTGNAGTTTRFLTALATLTGNKITIDGDKRMRERPIKELTKGLNKLGAKISSKNGFVPITIDPSPLLGGKINLPGNISSQYLSAILMIAPFAKNKTIINIEQKLYSKPYISMTLNMMKEFGFKVMNKNFRQFIVKPIIIKPIFTENSNQFIKNNRKKTLQYLIESDASSASYFGAYAALHSEKKILLKNIYKNSLQGDIKFLEYLKKMGCKISEQKNGTVIQGKKKLKSLGTIDMNETTDLVMTFAILALFSKDKTKITNIANLKIKETDRIQALKNEIKKLINFLNLKKFIKVTTGSDCITIQTSISAKTNKLKSTINIHTYNDHRIAMAFGILTDIFPFIKIENQPCVSKSYTTFWQDLKKCQK